MSRKKKIGKYILESKIGEGQFGQIFKCSTIDSHAPIAIKVIKKSVYQTNQQLLLQLHREIKIMEKLSHPNLLKLHEFFQSSKHYYIVMDYCSGGDLLHFMSRNKIKFFSEAESVLLLKHIRNGLCQLQKMNIVHRDLKLANLLVHGNNVIIGDFGTSKVFNGITTTTVGTPVNMAPEVLKGQPYDHKSDLWSLGILFFRMVFGNLPFYGFSIGDLLKQISEFSGDQLKFPKDVNVCATVKDFLKGLLTANPKHRMTWSQFKNHSIFSENHIINCAFYQSGTNSKIFKKFYLDETQGNLLSLSAYLVRKN